MTMANKTAAKMTTPTIAAVPPTKTIKTASKSNKPMTCTSSILRATVGTYPHTMQGGNCGS